MKKLTTFLALLAGLFMSSSAMAGVDYLVSNPVQVTDLNTLSDDSYYVLQHVGQGIYTSNDGSSVVATTNLDYSCVLHLLYNSDSGILNIQQVATETYYQSLAANQQVTLGETKVDYTVENPSDGIFRFVNSECYLHRNGNNPIGAALGFNGANSQWRIYKVEVEKIERPDISAPKQITDLTELSDDAYYVLKNYGSTKYACGELPLKSNYDYLCVVRLIYDGTNVQIQQICNDKYYQELSTTQPLEFGEAPVDYTFNTSGVTTSGLYRFANNSLYLNRIDDDSYLRGFGGTGNMSLWEIYEVNDVVLTLDESTDMAATINLCNGLDTKSSEGKGLGVVVNLLRKTVEGYNTVVLPFDLSAEQVKEMFGEDAVVYAFSDEKEEEGITVSFTSTDAGIEANVPVLVKTTKAAPSSQILKNITIESTERPVAEGKYVDFVGVYDAATVAEGDYFIGGSALYKSEGNTNIKPFRAYLQVKDEAAEVKLFIDGMATGIESINGTAKAEDGHIYSLAGQRVGKAQKGIYIVNGKKVVVK